MKKSALLLIASLALAGAGSAFAQSCASPLRMPPDPHGPHVVSGTTCTPAINQFSTLCGLFNSPENDVVYRFNIDAPRTSRTLTLSTTDPTWNAAFLYLSGSCGAGVSCAEVGDNFGAGGAETMPTPTAFGSYYLIVTSSPGSGGCGPFTVDAGGRLPVSLQSFSIDS